MKRPIAYVSAAVLISVPLAGTASAAPATARVDDQPHYRIAAIIDDPDSGAGTVGRGINERAEVVGYSGDPVTAFQSTKKQNFVALRGLPGEPTSGANEVNDAGVAVGSSNFNSSPEHAVRWVGHKPQALGTLEAGGFTVATSLNESGLIVGYGSKDRLNHAFTWTEDGGIQDIGQGVAVDVNESAVVAVDGGSHAYTWTGGTLTDLGVPTGFAFSHASAINDAGQVAGQVITADGNSQRIARWTPGTGWKILGGAGQHNVARGINSAGVVVGTGVPSSGIEVGVVYFDGFGLRALNDLLPTAEWNVLDAYDINDANEIAATGYNSQTGDFATLVLVPASVRRWTTKTSESPCSRPRRTDRPT